MLHFLFLSFSNVLFLSISNVLFLSIRYSEIYFLILSTSISLSLFSFSKIAFLSSVLSRGTRSAEKRPQPRTCSQRELVGNPRDVRDSANTGSVTGVRGGTP